MQAKAKLSYLRMAPKKVRLVASLIRGMKVEEASVQLGFVNKAAKQPILKLLNSAVANAENNFQLQKNNLFIKEIRVDQAGMLKRWKARAHGRATPIRKKTSHVLLTLEEIVPSKKKVKKEKKAEKAVKIKSLDEIKKVKESEKVIKADKSQVKKEGHEKEIDKEIVDVRSEGKNRHKQHLDKRTMKQGKGFITKIFNRKSG